MSANTITYRQQYSFCSKTGCRKCREGIGHGPYWYAYQVVQGRTVRTYIGKTLPAGVQAADVREASVPAEQPMAEPLASSSSQTPQYPTDLRLTTLGVLRLERRGEDESWQTVTEAGWRLPQARALLGFLLCAPDRQLTQQQACEILWPELDAKNATQNLRRASTALGQLLGPVYSKQAGTLLALAGQAQLWVDCTAFEELLTQARALPEEQRSARVPLLEQAIKLYGGDFFPEERAANWLQQRRRELRDRWLTAILDLVDLSRDEPRPTTALDLLDRLLAADPLNEAAVRRMMFLLARQQRRVEAVQAYQRLATLLHTTSQAAPSPETQALFHAIQQGDEALFKPLAAAASNPGEIGTTDEEAGMNKSDERREAEANGPRVPTITLGRANQSPLVGREREMAILSHLLAQVESKQGAQAHESNRPQVWLQGTRKAPEAQCVVLMGEAGIGKTRLAEESAREAQQRGWNVIWSHAYSQEQGIPYRLWIAALRSILTYTPELAQQAIASSPTTLYETLLALVPDIEATLLNGGGKAIPEVTSFSTQQEELRLREAVHAFLTALSLSAPLLLILDDIQWADESSSQMLGYLTRRMADYPIVILASCRETDLAANRTLSKLIASMQREQVVEIIHVQRLSDAQIGDLVAYLPASAISQIQDQAVGNPFFAEELAYSLQTSTTSDTQRASMPQGEAPALPGSIAAALNQRLNRLSDKCQELLSRAAVLGGSFNYQLIAEMVKSSTGGDEDLMLDLLDEALHSGVLTEEGAGAHVTYRFWHPLLASHLYSELSAVRRSVLHRKIADILRQLPQTHEGEEAATITRHLLRGGAEPARIAHYAELAAHHAYNLFAYADAEYYYRVALSQLAPDLLAPLHTIQDQSPLMPATSLEQRLHLAFLAERLAECTRVRGNFQDAPLLYLRAIQLRTIPPRTFTTAAEERQEAQIQAILWSEIAWIWRFTGDSAAARSCNARGEEVLRAAGITDGPAWGCLRHQQASLYWHEGHHQEALQASHQALDLFTACLAQSTPDHAAQQHTPATQQTRTMRTLQGDPVDLGRAHSFLGVIYAAIGQLSEALKHLQKALEIYQQHNRRREVAHVSCNIGHLYLLQAEYAQAQSFFLAQQSYVEQSGDILKSVLLYNLGELAAVDQQFDEAEKLYREGLTLVESINDREYISTWSAILGELLTQRGRFKEAATAILHALEIGRAVPRNQPCVGFALVALANLRCSLVEHEQACESVNGQRSLRHAGSDLRRALSLHGLDAEKRTQAKLAQARVSRLLGDLAQARQQALQARADAQTYELYALSARCQQLLDTLPNA